jgi:hypothetical protein
MVYRLIREIRHSPFDPFSIVDASLVVEPVEGTRNLESSGSPQRH